MRSFFEIFLAVVAPEKVEEAFVMNFVAIGVSLLLDVALVLSPCECPSQMLYELPHGEPLAIGQKALIDEEYSVYPTTVIDCKGVAIAQDDAIVPAGTVSAMLPVSIFQHFLENTFGQRKIVELGEVIDAEFPPITAEIAVFLVEFL